MESPNLDNECEEISREKAVSLVKDTFPPEYGLELRCFKSGSGEWFEYYREHPQDDKSGFLTWQSQNKTTTEYHPERSDLLREVQTLPHGASYVRDISLVPLKRMPKWGDGSAYYSCTACHQSLVEDEREYRRGKYYHEQCVPEQSQ